MSSAVIQVASENWRGLPWKVRLRDAARPLHFLLIISVSCRDTLRVVAEGPTILPVSFKNCFQKAETALSAALGQKLPASNPVREALNTYTAARRD